MIKHASVRIQLSLAVRNMGVVHLVVKIAFLHRETKEVIHMQLPSDLLKPGKKDLACKLHKKDYGLNQAARQPGMRN